jgi:hypothetical protein
VVEENEVCPPLKVSVNSPFEKAYAFIFIFKEN